MPAYFPTWRLNSGIGGALRAAVGLACVLLAAPVLSVQQTTALMVTPFHEGRVVHGDDGKDHVEYDLLVGNVFYE